MPYTHCVIFSRANLELIWSKSDSKPLFKCSFEKRKGFCYGNLMFPSIKNRSNSSSKTSFLGLLSRKKIIQWLLLHHWLKNLQACQGKEYGNTGCGVYKLTRLERFLPKNQHTWRKLLNFENWVNGEVYIVPKKPKFDSQGQFSMLKIIQIFLNFFFIEEYQSRSTFFVYWHFFNNINS